MNRRPCLSSYHEGEQAFLSVQEQDGDDQMNWTPYLCLPGPKTFSSSWISLTTLRQMPQTNSWSKTTATHIDTPLPGLEPWALITCDICWGVQGQPLPLWSPLFLDAAIPWHRPFNSTTILSGTAITVLWAYPGTSANVRWDQCGWFQPGARVQTRGGVDDDQELVWVERYPAATGRLCTMTTEAQRPIGLISPFLILDTQTNMPPLWKGEGHSLLLMRSSTATAHVAPG